MNVYICKNNVTESAAFLVKNESTLSDKTIEQVVKILEENIIERYQGADVKAMLEMLLPPELIYRGVYSLPSVNGDIKNPNEPALFINLYSYLGSDKSWGLDPITQTLAQEIRVPSPGMVAKRRGNIQSFYSDNL